MPINYDEKLVEQLRELFSKLKGEVKIYFFTDPQAECEHCGDIGDILDLVSKTADGKVKVYRRESWEGKSLGVDMFPALLIHGKGEWNIRYFGTPAGHEFGALVEDIIDASLGIAKVSVLHAGLLAKYVTSPTRIMVFVTPTCPYCPRAVRAVHRFAMANKNIYGDMVEALEFQELIDRYAVYAVPKTVIQVDGEDRASFEGVAPDPYIVAKILEAHGLGVPEALIPELEKIGALQKEPIKK